MEKTKEQLEWEIQLAEKHKEERAESNKLYAVKLVERVVFSLLASAFLYFAFWYFSHLTDKGRTVGAPSPIIQSQ